MNQTNTNVVDRWQQKRARHSHKHAPPVNVNQALVEILTPGERMADSFRAGHRQLENS
jgi:hypothetical protein